jgi:hypothetical protein
MAHKAGLLIIPLFLFIAAATFAQKKDSIPVLKDTLLSKIDSSAVFYFTHSRIDTTTEKNAHPIDTILHHTENYDPLTECQDFTQTNGNIGQANKNIAFSPAFASGFDYGIHAFDGYMCSNDKIKYYSSVAPFTELKLVMGSRKEQYFHVIHSHTIKKQLVIAANFRIINSLGRSSFRQKSDDISTYFTAYYNTKNNRYGVYAHYYYNRLKNMENGGIMDDTIYEQNREGRNATQFAYGLQNALNTVKENAWFLKQYVNLDFRKQDSTSGTRSKGFSLGFLTLTSTYQKPRFIYSDQDAGSGYYPMVYNDTLYTFDSVFYKKLENTIAWTNNSSGAKGRPSLFRFFAGFKHAYIEVHEETSTEYLNQYTPSAGFSLRLFGRFIISASGQYVIGTYNGGDIKGNALLSYRFGKEKYMGSLSLSGNYSLSEAPWIVKQFYSTYFRWNYDFSKQQIFATSVKYCYPRLETGINWYNLYNTIYWDNYAYPRQYSVRPVNVYSLYANKDFVFGKFEIDNKVILQYSDNNKIIHLPLLVASQSYLVTFDLFKKALKMQLGIDAWYDTPYYADAWMPASRQFYLQNDRKVGNYVYLDVFMNLKIKRAFLFLALDHFNSGLMGYKYYLTPHYPSTDRSLRFGVSWLFHD